MNESSIVVLDLGSFSTKIGNTGNDKHLRVHPSMIGKNIYPNCLTGLSEIKGKPPILGNQLQTSLSYIDIEYLINKQGQQYLMNWEGIEQLYSYLLTEELGTDDLNSVSLLHTLSPYFQKCDQNRILELMFETFQILEFNFVNEALSLRFGSGETNGILVELGHLSTRIYPFNGGEILYSNCQTLGVGGFDLTNGFAQQLKNSGIQFTSQEEFEIVTEIKHNCCSVNPFHQGTDPILIKKKYEQITNQNFGKGSSVEKLMKPNTNSRDLTGNKKTKKSQKITKNSKSQKKVKKKTGETFSVQEVFKEREELNVNNASSEEKIFQQFLQKDGYDDLQIQMPDNSEIRLSTERFQIPECLFNPKQVNVKQKGLHEQIIQVIQNCNSDLQNNFAFEKIILTGGNSELQFLSERLMVEILKNDSFDSSVVPEIISCNNSENHHLSWSGSSIIATICKKIPSLLIPKNDYHETGESILLKKIINNL
ncbi:actin-5c-related [Anaeramoeba flamelloides]|uniref:Actin-5c-related n=1 Tax=Anaeramoeba flamelloides TaxID=1746091 RepID=A0ABQ8XHN7_9EUKA|nr:actin-5c-related [Anaeramoeba flamelloides]